MDWRCNSSTLQESYRFLHGKIHRSLLVSIQADLLSCRFRVIFYVIIYARYIDRIVISTDGAVLVGVNIHQTPKLTHNVLSYNDGFYQTLSRIGLATLYLIRIHHLQSQVV